MGCGRPNSWRRFRLPERPEAVERAVAYLAAGADCVYPIGLWEPDALHTFIAQVDGPVNVLKLPQTPPVAELSATGVARVSWGPFLHHAALASFAAELAVLDR
ncbi:isocitrate lyase/phosphoenolpyruvate mutase family protein [Kribbella sandramycini]|uniref:2-methylisocitrate lyase-like PEP mutase family enzyme n=1 Tax=Kribbella sandramycini TaxID=60450 RepID=A0A841SJU9_9ACTN|nr:isocitrate lyase/phosphoenolpyruvate mutase family protein [Kribbella sandramycini]MBB6569703.1 2-methylisocitrate lyase-like PEP mutase family enzyme [Kribbella sandramycini]